MDKLEDIIMPNDEELKKLYCKGLKNMIDKTIESVSIQTSNNYCGLRFWELRCLRKDGKYNIFNLMVSTMQEYGVAKTLNSTKKVTNWLNSEIGLAWVNERKEEATSTGIGLFL
ncbi:hypothetical protein [Lysinibacillus irui]|uniref:Uncharacterized protein n=1 Tax=Lysinibacillus irui TaxID=2998077 RepID=A0AAJ5UTU3_9BACI|nr:hypothetical protein [Lysinibacillus irui]WDV09371.1 hypothetical protein OU989_22910 [Lysinibacillus irui]